MTKTKQFLSTCYGDPSATEVPPCFEAATRKLTFSTTSVLLLLDVPLSLSRGTIFRRQKNPRRGYRPKIAGILFVCNEPGRSIPYCAQTLSRAGARMSPVPWTEPRIPHPALSLRSTYFLRGASSASMLHRKSPHVCEKWTVV